MERGQTIFFIILFIVLILSNPASAAPLSPVKGGKLAEINFPIPKNPDEKKYLGLSGTGLFKIPQIKAKGVVIKIFNLYCPTCQAIASDMNEIYREIESNQDLKGKIKIIGIGIGNTLYEVEVYRNTNNILYPLFPDKEFNIHKALGEVRTPYIIAVKMDVDGFHKVVHTQLGGFTNASLFLELMLDACGLKEKGSPSKEDNLAISFPN